MNTYNLNLSSTTTNLSATYNTIELFDTTRLYLDLSNVDTRIFPNYVGIRWGDDTSLEEPQITLFRDYRSESIFPEIRKHASPPFFDVLYDHIFTPSSTALKKSMTMRVNIGYINGHTTYFTIPINVRTGSYYEDIEDLDLISVSLLDTPDNKSKFTYLTKKDNHILQNHSDNEIVYNSIGPDPLSSYKDTGNNGVNTTWRMISSTSNPDGSQAGFNFISGVTEEYATWETDWWGYATRDILNFSGVSYFGTGFRNQNNITLVTPKHGILVNHFSDDPAVDDIAYYYNHTTGKSVSAVVEATTQVTGSHPNMADLRVVRFDRDLTTALTSTGAAGNIKPYYLPQFDNEVPDFTFPAVYQAGNYAFDSDRHAGLGVVGGPTGHNIISIEDDPGGWAILTHIESKDLGEISTIFSSSFFGLSGLANGDSGSPIFILYDNEILLASIFQAGAVGQGSGPNLGNSYVNANITSAINTVGNSEGYTLSTVRLS